MELCVSSSDYSTTMLEVAENNLKKYGKMIPLCQCDFRYFLFFYATKGIGPSFKQNVGQHIRNAFKDGELAREVVVKKFFTTTQHVAAGRRHFLRWQNLRCLRFCSQPDKKSEEKNHTARQLRRRNSAVTPVKTQGESERGGARD